MPASSSAIRTRFMIREEASPIPASGAPPIRRISAAPSNGCSGTSPEKPHADLCGRGTPARRFRTLLVCAPHNGVVPSTWEIDVALGKRLFSRARAERWHLSRLDFERALQASAAKFFTGRSHDTKEVARFLESLHLEDLALACACAAGDDGAWEHFVREFRPLLYRSADAIDS